MKKYFLKGREFLTKKLQELEIEAPAIDYVGDQIPQRLKQPLSVLRSHQIDLEDSMEYETYFKNYPNHHLSHYLLEKYRSMEKEQPQPQVYIPPQHINSYIAPFDEELEKKALLFKEAVEEYDQGYSIIEEPIVCICVIHFHHKRGTEVEYRFPENSLVQKIENMIVHHAMPDSSHNKPEDYNFFNFQIECQGKKRMLFGVSYFKQIKITEEMRAQNKQLTRSHLQKAVAIVSTLPLFGYLKLRLATTTKVFFQQFNNFQIIQMAYHDLKKHLTETWPQTELNDLYIGSDLKAIIELFGAHDFYEIWKAVLHQRKIVIFAHSSSSASSFILSLLTLFPGLSAFGIFSQPISKYMQSLREYALPLRIFNSDNFLSMSFHVQDFGLLAPFIKKEEGNYLLGTTNRLLKQSNDYGIELLVNLENCTVEKRKSRRPWDPLSKREKVFVSELEELIQKQTHFDLGGTEDEIRNHFHKFLKASLLDMMIAIRAFRNFVSQCKQYAKHAKKTEKKMPKKSDYQFMEEEADNENYDIEHDLKEYPPNLPPEVVQTIFPNLLLNKSFTYFLQFHNQSLPEIIMGKSFPSLLINGYDYLLRLNSEDFIQYNWVQKKLCFGKGLPKNYDGKEIRFSTKKLQSEEKGKHIVRSIYVGLVQNGRYSKHGFYVDENDHYEGEYCQGIREGYGKYMTNLQKYIGDFHNNLYEGSGQLIVGKEIYVGEFKEGLRHGKGSIQGSFNFEGEWENDKPKLESLQQIEKKKVQEQ